MRRRIKKGDKLVFSTNAKKQAAIESFRRHSKK